MATLGRNCGAKFAFACNKSTDEDGARPQVQFVQALFVQSVMVAPKAVIDVGKVSTKVNADFEQSAFWAFVSSADR